MRILLVAFILASFQPCPAADAINTPDEALAKFRAIMRKRVEERTGKKVPDDYGNNSRSSAGASTSLAVQERVKSTLMASQYKSSITVGSLASLTPDRKVWVVGHYVDVWSGFEAVLDAKDGNLIFLWWIPEG